jgi:hypothetical protein
MEDNTKLPAFPEEEVKAASTALKNNIWANDLAAWTGTGAEAPVT